MNRKYFLSSLSLISLSAFGSLKASSHSDVSRARRKRYKIPAYLKAGDTIGITCPAGYISMEEIMPSVKLMESWGYAVKIGKTVGARDFTFGGTDAERLTDFQEMLDDGEVKAIMCARGGYGAVRIIDQLDFRKFSAQPKWIIGFSDITVFHCHLDRNYQVASIHSKMCNSFPADWTKAQPIQIETILSIRQALAGQSLKYSSPNHVDNRFGKVEAILVGGNLSIIETLAGSASDLDTDGKILFIEDTGESLYAIDRMFWNLKRSGKLSKLKGLIIGGFNMKGDTDGDQFGRTIEQIVLEKVKEYAYPLCFNFPVGHQRNNFALKCGVRHILEVGAAETSLTSIS